MCSALWMALTGATSCQLPFKEIQPELNPLWVRLAIRHCLIIQLCYPTRIENQTKLQDHQAMVHGSVGVTFEGLLK